MCYYSFEIYDTPKYNDNLNLDTQCHNLASFAYDDKDNPD